MAKTASAAHSRPVRKLCFNDDDDDLVGSDVGDALDVDNRDPIVTRFLRTAARSCHARTCMKIRNLMASGRGGFCPDELRSLQSMLLEHLEDCVEANDHYVNTVELSAAQVAEANGWLRELKSITWDLDRQINQFLSNSADCTALTTAMSAATSRSAITARLREAEKKRKEMKLKLERSQQEIAALQQQQQRERIFIQQASTDYQYRSVTVTSSSSTVSSRTSHYSASSSTVVSSSNNQFQYFPVPAANSADWITPPYSSSIKPFNGDPKEWTTFIQQFHAEVHDAMTDDSLRLDCLNELLSPDVRNLFDDAVTYGDMLKKLTKHYDQLVLRSCLTALKQLPPVPHDDAETLRHFIDQVHDICDSLKVADLNSFCMFELSGLTNKLNLDLRDKWAEYVQQMDTSLPNINEFAIWLDTLQKHQLMVGW